MNRRTLLTAAYCGIAARKARAEGPGRRLLLADDSKRRVAILASDGKVEWERRIRSLHDLHLLPGGTVLMTDSFQRVVEVDPKSGREVWSYDAATSNGNAGRRVEVHAIQRLPDGTTMIAESGPGRVIDVRPDGSIAREFKLRVGRPDPHRDTRLARRLRNGNTLVAHEGDGVVREYSPDGAVAWEYEVPLFGEPPRPGHGPESYGNQLFSALRLPNGNTLLGTGNGHRLLEVTPDRRIAWKVEQRELPGIVLAWVTTLQVMPSGNFVFGNCHAGPEQPQIVEITREKQVVWTYRNFDLFGNSLTNSQVLDVPGTLR